jgi:hypothetical protein
MPDQIPHGFQTSDEVPNPVIGRSEANLRIVAVGQQDALRKELDLGLNLAIFVVRLSPPAYPEHTYVAEMTPVEAATPIVVPRLRYGVSSRPAIPPVPKARRRWPPPEAPTGQWFFPYRSPLIEPNPEDFKQVTRGGSPVFYVPGSSPVSYVPIQVVLWRRRVYCEGTPLYLEARWTFLTGETTVIKGVEKDPRPTSVARALKGLKLLKVIEATGGRPPDIEDKASFWQFYWDSYQKVFAEKRRDGNKLPSKSEVAAEILMTPKTLKRYRDRYNLPWPPLPPL